MRYFFDLDGEGIITTDTDGLVCESPVIMRRNAMNILAKVAGDAIATGEISFKTRVRDEQGRDVYEATLVIAGRELI